jgi:hypothetical protein
MGTTPSSSDVGADLYAIKLQDAEQSVRLYGFVTTAKQTLTWQDVLSHKTITLASCIACGIPDEKLHRMQPKMMEWVRHGKASISDCHLMGQWRPNPFTDLRCTIGDIVLNRQSFPAQVFVDCGVTFQEMRDRYGMGPELMGFLKYTPDEWLALGVDAEFLESLSDTHWDAIFGKSSVQRKDLIMRCKRS